MFHDSNGQLWSGIAWTGGPGRSSGNDTDYDESSSVELAIIAGCIGR
jgi:hypothetical protein